MNHCCRGRKSTRRTSFRLAKEDSRRRYVTSYLDYRGDISEREKERESARLSGRGKGRLVLRKKNSAIQPEEISGEEHPLMELTDAGNYKPPSASSLADLIEQLHRVFESDHINVEYVHDLMLSYKSNPKEWQKYAKFDRHRYTRNLVDEGNGKFNLMILCWSENQGSSIHDHANAHCFMKVLAGQLKEVRFDWPKETEGPDSPLKMGEENLLPLDSVAYINDSLGLHRVENPSHSEQAVSLHLYCPPFDQCLMFDQRTGHKSVSKVTFWSKFGERTPFMISSSEPIQYENN